VWAEKRRRSVTAMRWTAEVDGAEARVKKTRRRTTV
jgi:hypothetical protein